MVLAIAHPWASASSYLSSQSLSILAATLVVRRLDLADAVGGHRPEVFSFYFRQKEWHHPCMFVGR